MSDAQIVKQILADCRHQAMESLDDDNVPEAVRRLVAVAEIDTGSKVYAVKRGIVTDYVPDGTAKIGGPIYQWHARAMTGTMRPGEPKRVKRERACYNLIVDGRAGTGNPIAIEAWFKENGVDASASNPTQCQIVIE